MPNPPTATALDKAIDALQDWPKRPEQWAHDSVMREALQEIQSRLRALEAKKPGKGKGAGK